jgi:beta-lactam-binding protein with PASTA domain/predicted Ser/Thr protein kinase
MAEVYRARDELLGREVAIKVLSARSAQDKSFVERFRREAQSAANLNHPNIVSLYDYGSDEGAYYIVMEFIDGRSLAEVIAQDGRLMPERAAEIASDVAGALERAHGAGIVHRDIKPGNIMLTSLGQTKVTDFGIARALGGDSEQTMTQTGMVIGTAAYLSPEQAQGEPVDARSDVYSLGIVLYEMLTGNPPFAGDTPLSIAYKHVRETPERVSTVNPDVPAPLESIISKALAKNPENRYTHAGEMKEDLQRFLAGQKVLATPMMADETMVAPATGTQVMRSTDVFEDEEPEKDRAGMYVIGALLILALFGLIAYLLAQNLFGEDAKMVQVPKVIGLTEEEATSDLEEVGFVVEVETAPSRRAEGKVFAQDPEAREEAEEGSTVIISVSEGREQVEVPDLEGEAEEDAADILEGADLKLGETTTEPSDEFEEGLIIGQSESPGSEVDAGTAVDIVVSSGEDSAAVPNVVGFTEDAAIATLQNAGFEVEVQTAPDEAEAGVVVSQDPEAGSEHPQGDTVVILVSEGSEERAMPNVVGMDADEAQAYLENDFGLTVTREEEACTEPPGNVCRQDPEEGTPVSEGDTATLFVQPDPGAGLPSRAFFALLMDFFALA